MRLLALTLLAALLGSGLPSVGSATPPTVSIHQSYGAGEWIVVYVYVPEGTNVVTVAGAFSISVQAPLLQPVGLFAMPPAGLAEKSGAMEHLAGPALPRVEIQRHGGSLARAEEIDGAIATTGVVGTESIVAVQMAFAASHAWRLDLDVTIPQATFAIVHRYGGAVFASPENAATPIAGLQQMQFQVPGRGWTHLTTESTRAQPIGLRTYDVRFPNGFRFSGSGQMVGVDALVLGSANGNNYWGGFGATSNAPGLLTAHLQYVETSLGAPLALVHLPWPANHGLYSVNYKTLDGGLLSDELSL